MENLSTNIHINIHLFTLRSGHMVHGFVHTNYGTKWFSQYRSGCWGCMVWTRKQLADAEAEIAKGTSISAGALKMNQEQRKEAEKGLKKLEEIKNENKRQDENSRKILGISERRFEAVKKGNQNLKDQETILKTLEDQAKELGVKVESLGGYEKEKAKFERMKRRQELRGAGPFKIIANEFKVFGKKFQDTVNLSFGPEGKLISKLTDIGSGLKTKVAEYAYLKNGYPY